MGKSRWMTAVLALCILTIAYLAYGLGRARATSGIVRARGFALVDGKGTVRAFFGLNEGNQPELRMLDAKGRTRARMDVQKDGGPGFALSDEEGKGGIGLTILGSGEPGLVLADRNGVNRSGFAIRSDGVFLSLSDREQANNIMLVARDDGIVRLALIDSHPRIRGEFSLDPDGSPSVRISGKDGAAAWSAP